MTAFFEVDTGHDRQINRPAQIDQIRIALILDVHLLFLRVRFLFRALIIVILLVLILIAVFSKNFCLQLLVGFLVFLPLRVKLENVEGIL